MPIDNRKPDPKPARSPDERPSRALWRWACVSIFLLALLARALFGTLQMTRMAAPTDLQFPDEREYWQIACSVHDGDGYVGEFGHRADRMPLYPGLLALAAGLPNGVAYARGGQWLLGAIGAVLVAFLAARTADPPTGVVAGLIMACDPGLVGVSNLLLTETVFVTLVATWWLIGWPLGRPPSEPAASSPRWLRWALTGVTAAACVYVRPGAVILVVLWTAYVAARRGLSRRAVAGATLIVLIVVASLLPWAYRNHRATGRWCWLTTRAGISLYDGVRYGASGASDLADVKNRPEVAGLSEHEWNDYFTNRSWAVIREDPIRIVRLGFTKLGRTWSPFLHADELSSRAIRIAFGAWSLMWYLMIGLGLWAYRRDRWLCIGMLLPAVAICVLHFFYVGSVRYRLGATPTLAVLAALGVVCLMRSARAAHRRSEPGTNG